mmetsp:Transcript_40111/g.67247  ORF Transcript_40111/g.67247 Transcript_40111/m.67247 type:complete len:236 (-) Transcript_40111:164-871(-)
MRCRKVVLPTLMLPSMQNVSRGGALLPRCASFRFSDKNVAMDRACPEFRTPIFVLRNSIIICVSFCCSTNTFLSLSTESSPHSTKRRSVFGPIPGTFRRSVCIAFECKRDESLASLLALAQQNDILPLPLSQVCSKRSCRTWPRRLPGSADRGKNFVDSPAPRGAETEAAPHPWEALTPAELCISSEKKKKFTKLSHGGPSPLRLPQHTDAVYLIYDVPSYERLVRSTPTFLELP